MQIESFKNFKTQFISIAKRERKGRKREGVDVVTQRERDGKKRYLDRETEREKENIDHSYQKKCKNIKSYMLRSVLYKFSLPYSGPLCCTRPS